MKREDKMKKLPFCSSDVECATHPNLCEVNVKMSFCKKQDMCSTLSFQAHKLTLLVRGGVQWRNKENHTVKLGGMFASICVFDKVCCD